MQATHTTHRIGLHEIAITDVRDLRALREEGGVWLAAQVQVTVTTEGVYGQRETLIRAGCWLDTDDDHQLWSADHEGDRAISLATLGTDTDGRLMALMPHACRQVGESVTAAIRADYDPDDD